MHPFLLKNKKKKNNLKQKKKKKKKKSSGSPLSTLGWDSSGSGWGQRGESTKWFKFSCLGIPFINAAHSQDGWTELGAEFVSVKQRERSKPSRDEIVRCTYNTTVRVIIEEECAMIIRKRDHCYWLERKEGFMEETEMSWGSSNSWW